MDGTITDAEITGNGVYTVGVTDLNGCLTGDPDAVLSMIYVDTDVPVSAKDTFQISDVTLKMDDKTQTLPDELFYNEEAQGESGLIRFDPVNTYQRDQGEYPDCPSVITPTNSIEITFTVSGMANDNPDAVAATEEDTATSDDTTAASDDTEESASSGTTVAVVVVVVVVVVIAGVAVVVTRRKK
jgi:hypothetical protein